jgi:hypothetical protein
MKIAQVCLLAILSFLSVTCSNNPPADSGSVNLSNLTISSGSLEPGFNPATTSYTIWYDIGVTGVSFTPVAESGSSWIQWRIGGSDAFTDIVSGASTGSISLSEGSNTIEFRVTSGVSTEKTYTILANRVYLRKWDTSSLLWNDAGLVWY